MPRRCTRIGSGGRRPRNFARCAEYVADRRNPAASAIWARRFEIRQPPIKPRHDAKFRPVPVPSQTNIREKRYLLLGPPAPAPGRLLKRGAMGRTESACIRVRRRRCEAVADTGIAPSASAMSRSNAFGRATVARATRSMTIGLAYSPAVTLARWYGGTANPHRTPDFGPLLEQGS